MSVVDAVRVATEGMTQEQIADALGIKQGDVSKMFSGYRGRRFGIEHLARIEDALGQPRGFILGLAGYATSDGARAAEKMLSRGRPSAEAEGYDEMVERLRDLVRRRQSMPRRAPEVP